MMNPIGYQVSLKHYRTDGTVVSVEPYSITLILTLVTFTNGTMSTYSL